uniref:arginyltransferase n=1 Tax=Marinobacter sp. TaxID=50741 RepID=UPI003566A92E
MSNLRTLVFFATPAHDCSYLPNREATTMFVDPRAEIDKKLYSQLTALGFRRSGSHYYRPHCDGCSACIPVRLKVDQFQPDRNQRRVLSKNSDIECRLVPAAYSERYYGLYAHYIEERHQDGDMYPPTREQFTSFLVEGSTDSWFLEMTLNGELVGLAAIDLLNDGLSAIYTVFAPEYDSRSLGTYAVLWQIQETQRRELPHLY